MPDFYHLQSNFTQGEWSPKLAGQTELAQFKNAAETLENYIVRPLGGIFPKPGTDFVARAKDPTNNVIIFPFEFSTEQAYILEFGHEYIRFYANRGRLEGTAVNITGAADSGSGTIKITAVNSFASNDYVAIRNVLGTTEANQDWQIASPTSTDFILVSSAFINAYVSGGTAAQIIEISSPYQGSDLYELNFTQSKDVLYIQHRSYQDRTLTRTAATTFILATHTREYGPFQDLNTTSTTLTPSATSGTITVTSSSSSVPGFTSDYIGSLLRVGLTSVNQIPYGEITAVADATSLTLVVKNSEGLLNTSATTDWALPLFSAVDGWPDAGAFFEQRLILARDQIFAGSINGTPARFDEILSGETEVTDDAAFVYKLASRQQNVIQWISPLTFMFVGTSGAEYRVQGGNNSALTPTNVSARRQDTEGSKKVMPWEIKGNTIFVDRPGRKILGLKFSIDADQYIADDLTLFNPEISESTSGFIQIAVEQKPNPIVWAVRSDGLLCCLTYLESQNVRAWARHPEPGSGKCVSVAKIPAASSDEIWVAVKRTIQSVDDIYIEVQNRNHMLNSAISASGSGLTTVTGADHLNGQTVAIVGDNANIVADTVSNGTVEVAQSSDEITVGLQYTPTCKLFRPSRVFQNGTSDGRPMRIVGINMRVNNAGGFTVNDIPIPLRSTDDLFGTAPSRVTGFIEKMGTEWGKQITIKQNIPLPGEILSITQFVEAGD